jgi:Kef-type K+ transport system membrane component KefB
MKKIIGYYIALIGILTLGLALVIGKGSDFGIKASTPNTNNSLSNQLLGNFNEPIAKFLLQVIIILLVARILGWLMIKIGQPTVIGDIIAGLLLGPSLLGHISPEFSQNLFNPESLGTLNAISKVGLILFMFIIGLELDFNLIKAKIGDSLFISHSGIVTAFLSGIFLSYYLYPNFAPENISFISFMLFIGIAMSITAFPVLARIMQEQGMIKTPIGNLALTIAASDDIAAWFLLAFVIAAVHTGTFAITVSTIFLALAFILFMLLFVKKFLAKYAESYFAQETFNKRVFGAMILLIFASAYVAELIGINAMFGAFLAGVVVPTKTDFRELLAHKLEDISLVLFLPIFFVITGLKTEIGLLNNGYWGLTFLVIGVAIVGKSIGLFTASKISGYSNKDSLTICTLMNTRGLMELIVLNIGHEFGILNKTLFTIFVIMALVTTFMTTPLVKLIKRFKGSDSTNPILPKLKKYNLLFSFGPSKSGVRLLQLANQLGFNSNSDVEITGMHLTPSADISILEAQKFEQDGFEPVLNEAKFIGTKMNTNYKATNDVSREIINYANENNFDMMMVGSSKAVFDTEETGGKVKGFLDAINCTVGVLVDKGFNNINNILTIVDQPEDAEILKLLERFISNGGRTITIADDIKLMSKNLLSDTFKLAINKRTVNIVSLLEFENLNLSSYQLMIVSRTYWLKAKSLNESWINISPTVLVIG